MATVSWGDKSASHLPTQVPAKFVKYILPKGFIAVDGISLTVGEVGEDCFSVYLIPETLRVTTLGLRKEGDAVNIEIEAQTQVLFGSLTYTTLSFVQPYNHQACVNFSGADNAPRELYGGISGLAVQCSHTL